MFVCPESLWWLCMKQVVKIWFYMLYCFRLCYYLRRGWIFVYQCRTLVHHWIIIIHHKCSHFLVFNHLLLFSYLLFLFQIFQFFHFFFNWWLCHWCALLLWALFLSIWSLIRIHLWLRHKWTSQLPWSLLRWLIALLLLIHWTKSWLGKTTWCTHLLHHHTRISQ